MGQRKVWAFSNVNIYCHYLCQLQSFGWNSLIGLSSPSDTICIFVCGPAVYCCLPFVFLLSSHCRRKLWDKLDSSYMRLTVTVVKQKNKLGQLFKWYCLLFTQHATEAVPLARSLVLLVKCVRCGTGKILIEDDSDNIHQTELWFAVCWCS